MRVIWAPEAIQARLEIWQYIAESNPIAAEQMDTLFSDAAKRLSDHPEMGKEGLVVGTRELIPHSSYRLVYEVISEEEIWITALMSTAKAWPPM